MDISQIVSEDYVEFSPDTRVSKVTAAFDDPGVKGVVVHGDAFEGVVTRRQLVTSRRQPDQKVGSLVWHVPKLTPDEDVRKVAQLMIDSDSQLLPVFEGQTLVGVVTVDDVLEAVRPHLDAATVSEAATHDLVTLDPESTFGEALHELRENRIAHLPVVEDDSAVGILSLYDVTDISVRSGSQSQGGDAAGTDSFGGPVSDSSGRARRGGYGAREGERDRMLDLPVRNVMSSPVRTIDPAATLQDAVDQMFSFDGSALVVTDDGTPHGIVTKTDILDSLTWEAGGQRSVQVSGIDLVDDVSHDDIVAMVDKFDDRDHGMTILDAKIHFHEHDEKRRGTPLLLARIRLHTDDGLYVASGEGYGANHALNEVKDVLERQIRDRKTEKRPRSPTDEAFWEKRFAWMLE
jgi:CBS domain-containing protein